LLAAPLTPAALPAPALLAAACCFGRALLATYSCLAALVPLVALASPIVD